jgi:PAS domain S-box-containing protein
MVEDSEYVLEPLREGEDFTLYRGRGRGNQMPILAVAVAAEQPSLQNLRRLEHEYSLAAELDTAWAARPFALSRHQGRAVLILEDPGGEPLDRIIEQHKGQPINLTRFLRTAIGLTAALSQAHRQGLIHKDVKPANALVDDSGQVWLTGFGIASRLPRERQSPEAPEFVAGSLPYMAPEQTGRMNRSIDSRSDLYSLGVTLYEMSTGSLPFTASDPMGWVHCQIARQPLSPHERARDIPSAVSAITMKLLAKDAEDRYQTALGLERDLQRCLIEWEALGRIDEFPLREHDTRDRLLIPERLYGRAAEINTLLASFDRVVAGGNPELVLVSGYSGVGKSSVVNELHKPLVPPRGLFASGKFDQYKRDIPHATLAQAFQSLIRPLLAKNEEELGRWRDSIREALGANGQLMVDLVPELKLIIGEQQPVPELPPQDAQSRFQLVFRRFISVFTREHPLALFLDDLQWLDPATLDLMENLLTHPDVKNLMLIGAYRDNEVNSTHPLMRKLEAVRLAGATVHDIVLAPLTRDHLEELIADSLNCERGRAEPLAELVEQKTAGNPFFAIQFFSALAEESLLTFDYNEGQWSWDLNRIHARGYTDNVVDLMVGKLRRLSARTQIALQQIACLGNMAEITTLRVVFGEFGEEIHAALLEAVRTGVILRLEGSYAFLHDRIQEAAYALIPRSNLAAAHLRIGRALFASLTADGLAERLFDVANQLNRGAELLIDHNEKVNVAAIDLRTGRKAKASAAYTSARTYFASGMALLDERDWSGQYELMFSLSLELAECELLSGNPEKAEQLIMELLLRAASKVDEAAVYRLKVQFHVIKSDNPEAVATALMCLRRFGFDMPTHPSQEQAEAEYETLWQALDGRPIESLIDLPLLTDPELKAAMRVFSVLTGPAYFTDSRLWFLQVCRMVKISLQYGTSNACIMCYASMSNVLNGLYHRYSDAYRFGKLACDVAEKHGFIEHRTNAYLSFGLCAVWTQPIAPALGLMRKAFTDAMETGDSYFACTSLYECIVYLLLRNDPLDGVWRETELALDFTLRAKLDDVADIIVIQQRFIATMQGRTANFSTFSDTQFDEAAFEARLTAGRMPILIGWYWILKLKARFLSSDYAEALEAAEKAKQLLEASIGQIAVLDYFYYAALTVAALYETASADQQATWRELLKAHREQLREWAENYPPTFDDKDALVLAEIARLEKRDADALPLYEQAIHSAREHGFVQNEGLAHELAGQYYLALGIETAGYAYLRNARNCYDRWGAHGKVRQLDGRYPRLREGPTLAVSATIGQPVGQLDVEAVVKASQALSSEIVLPALIEKLLRIAVENAGAERGLLILLRGDARGGEPRVEAEATTGPGKVEVVVRQAVVTPFDLLQSALQYVIRTQERVLLDDASADILYSKDEYVRRKRSRSVLCLPIIKQAKLVGALYLENNLTPSAFTSDQVAVLQLLASQAAISLENATVYSDLQLQAGLLQNLPVSAWTLKPDGTPDFVNQVWLDYSGQTLDFVRSHPEAWMTAIHPEDREAASRAFWGGVRLGQGFAVETRSLRAQDGTYRWHLTQSVVLRDAQGKVLKFVGTSTDIDDQKRAEEALRQAQGDLARINRVTTMGELAASLAHELSQPISGAITNANVCLRKLGNDQPNFDEVRTAVTRIGRDAQRAADIITRIRSQFEKGSPKPQSLDVNEIIPETIALLRDEAVRYGIAVRTELAVDLPQIVGDRVQLQQVAMNLIVNSIEAMKEVDGMREIVIQSQRAENDQILVSFTDTGIGLPPQLAEQIFEPFFTTKTDGTGMGLRISRSIIESHGGRLWAVGSPGRGATFHLNLPTAIPSHR